MSESRTTSYKSLFQVRLLHHFWLDDGATLFDELATEKEKETRLKNYDTRKFLRTYPTASTKALLAGKRCIFKDTALGFVVAAPAETEFTADTILQFVISIKDPAFYQYTALTLQSQQIVELLNSVDNKIYRYKENVAHLSNLTGSTRGSGSNKELFLSRQNPNLTSNEQVEALVLSGSALVQLTSDGPSATTQELSAQANDWPVFLHQGDSPEIVAPTGISGAPSHGILLSDEITDDVYALLSLSAENSVDSLYSYIDAQGHPKSDAPIFQVRFKNRSTFWRYLDKVTGAEKSIESSALPLTFYGNAGSKQKPSDRLVKPELAGVKITRLVSDVYV